MGKFKAAVAVLLTLALLITGAYIPKLVACFSDRQTAGKGSLNPMASVELNIYREISSMGKLAMMNRIDSLLPIRESKARMSDEEVMDAVYEGLAPYMDTKLVTYYENRVEMRPYLVQVLDTPELQRVIWQITVSGDDSDFTFFDLIVDDETGNILRINYTAENPQSPYVKDEVLTLFADIFFSSLGIEDYWSFIVEDFEYAYIGDNTIAVRFRFEDKQYGEVNIDLYVHDNGFYIEFPNIK